MISPDTQQPSPERMVEILQKKLARAETALAEAETALEGRMRELDLANRELLVREEDLVRRLDLQNMQLLNAQRTGGFATIFGAPDEAFQSSPQLNAILGFPADTKLTPEHLTSVLHPLDRNRMIAEATQFYTDLPADEDHTFEHRIIHPGTGTRWLRWHIRRSSGDANRLRGIYGSVRDITEIRSNERTVKMLQLRAERRVRELDLLTGELEAEREKTEAALAVRTRFLSTMAHNFRTPLATLSGVIDLLEGAADSDGDRRKLDLAEHSVERIGALLDEALAESEGQSDSIALFAAPLSLGRLLDQSRRFWAEVGANQQGEMSWQLADDLPAKVVADAVRLRELIDNLCGFAMEEGHGGSVAVAWKGGLSISLTSDRLGYELARGSDALQDPQFRRAMQLAEAMGGGVTCDATGCAIVLALETAADDGAGMSAPLRTAAGDSPQVLLAEDTESNRQIITSLLEKIGCTVQTATNGAEAVELISKERFDAVLMDVQMPVMDGEQAVRTIRAMDGPASRTPVIGVTAHSLQEERERLLAAGMSACLAKPVKQSEIKAALTTALAAGAGAAAGDQGGLPLFDLVRFRQAFEALPAHFGERFLAAVKSDLVSYGDALTAALEQGDREAADRQAHALKGVAGNVGALRLLGAVEKFRAPDADWRGAAAGDLAAALEETYQGCDEAYRVLIADQ